MKGHPESEKSEVKIKVTGKLHLVGDLAIPPQACGLVVFAHGSGSSRHSSRNRYVASLLNDAGIATLLFDLLTREEGSIDLVTRELRFDIELLAQRLTGTVDWLRSQPDVAQLPIGLFGASTGVAAALITAASRPNDIAAVVSRGGRPDLAFERLSLVKTPTLLIVGGHDDVVIELNESALRKMRTECQIRIIPGATHLFEEPGTLEQVATLAADWFQTQFRRGR